MARTAAEAQLNATVWTLLFEDGSRDRLRVGGFFAGHNSKEDLKTELRRQFWEQEQRKDDENLGHYLVARTSSTNPSVVKDMKAGKKKASRDVISLDHPVSYATRLAEKKSKLEAAEKRRLARKVIAAKKKRKLANDHDFSALGIRRAVTRSSNSRA